MHYLNKLIEYGFFLFIFFIPWQARWIIAGGRLNNGYWEYGTYSLYATEVLLWFILLAVIIRGIILLRKNHQALKIKKLFFPAGALLLFIIWSGLSIFWSIDKGVALEHWRMLVEAGVVFLLLSIIATHRGVFLRQVIIASVFIQAIIAIGQFCFQFIPSSTILGIASQSPANLGAAVVETTSGRWLRAYGSFPHPNILGGWLVLGLVLLIADSEKRIANRFNISLPAIRYSLIAIFFFALLATFSRSALLAFILFSIFYFLFFFKRQNRAVILKIAAVTTIVFAVFLFLFSSLFFSRITVTGRLEAKSNIERISSWRQSWLVIKQQPLFGVGLGNYGLAVHKYINQEQPAWYYQPVHNLILLIWSELGLIGLIIIFYFLFSIFQKHRQPLSVCLYILPFLSLSFFDHYFWSLYPGLMIGAVYFGLINICSKSH